MLTSKVITSFSTLFTFNMSNDTFFEGATFSCNLSWSRGVTLIIWTDFEIRKINTSHFKYSCDVYKAQSCYE